MERTATCHNLIAHELILHMIFNILRTFLTNKNRSACGNAMTEWLNFGSDASSVGSCFPLSHNSCYTIDCRRARRDERRGKPDVSVKPSPVPGVT